MSSFSRLFCVCKGTSAAVINVVNPMSEASRVSSSQVPLQPGNDPVTADQTEPPAKRSRAVVLDLATLVKEAVFDAQQVIMQAVYTPGSV